MQKIYKNRGVLCLCPILIFLLFSQSIFAHTPERYSLNAPQIPDQQLEYILTGTVKDSYGPMPGVHVLIKGTDTGTFTDKQGDFSLTVSSSSTLVFSYLGYHTLEVSILGRTTLEVELKPEATQLQEVEVNAGYYTVKERERTGSISRVTAEEIELQPIVSPLEALQGRMAGVEVVQRSGVPGSAPVIRIRGQNSLRNTATDNGNLPLYIVDGVPINASPIASIGGITNLTGLDPLSTLNLAIIESIEILKDADATAIYGSRGANGVVLISTKKPKGYDPKTEVDVRLYSGISKVSNQLQLLNTEQYLALRKEAFENDNVTPTQFNAPDLVLWDQKRYTDWQKELLGGSALVTALNVGVSGGRENTIFRLGGSYYKTGTVFPGDASYHKLTTSLNLNHLSKDNRFIMNLSVNYGIDNNKLFNGNTFVSQALTLQPNAPALYDTDGSLNWENSTWANPFGMLKMETRAQAHNLISNLRLSYHIGKELMVKTNIGYTILDSEEKVKRPLSAYDPAIWDRLVHSSFHGYGQRKSWIIEPQITYSRTSNIGSFDALIGTTFQHNTDGILRITGTGYSNEQLIGNLAAADAVTVSLNENIHYKYNAVFGRMGYNFQRKYFLNLTGRRDGSSRFGQERRFANFGAVGGAWIFSEEAFIKGNRSFLSFGKIRGSYGITGSDQIGNYGYMDTYEATPGPGGLYPTTLTNPDYSWESNKKLEAALELGFIQDRIKIGVNWYRNRSSNQLVGYPLPAMSGFGSVQANLPATVENRGWEIEWSSLNIQTQGFLWQTQFNFSYPENRLLSYPNIELSSYANQYRIGHPLNIALLYKFDGIDPETGLYKVVDANEDGRLDIEDRIMIRNLGRKYFGGINNDISYKGLSLSFLLEFVKQQGFQHPNLLPGRNSNITIDQARVWTLERQQTNIQIASQAFPAYIAYLNAQNSEFNVVDASFLRLKTLSLAFKLPRELLKAINIKGGQLYVQTQNLFTVSRYTGLDPQNPASTLLPVLRSITCGVQVQF